MAQRREFPQEFRGSVSEIVDGVRRGDSTERCTELYLNWKGIGDSEVSQLCTVLSHFTALEILWLQFNHITSVGVSELCNVLKLCERLTVLSLGGNSIDDIGAKLIAKTLTDTKLEGLYINDNEIGRDGICALLLSAKSSKTLKELSINGNSGVSLALEDIEEILPHYRTLQRLVLGWVENELSEEFRQRIRTVMKRCTKSLKVWLSDDEDISGSLEFAPALFDSALFHREFLSAVQRCGGISVYRSRVSFVGDSRVGKTWTAKSLRGEPNFHPQTPEECNAQRTAAAESTALQIGDVAFWDWNQLGEIVVNEDAEENSGAGDSGPSTSVQSTAAGSGRSGASVPDEVSISVQSTAAESGRSEASGSDEATPSARADPDTSAADANPAGPLPDTTEKLYKQYDNVHTAQLPTGLLAANDTRKPVCYLTLWDFGGQKMYHSWYQFFFSPGMIPCVVFDMLSVVPRKVRDPPTPPPPPKLSWWRRFFQFFGPKQPPVEPVQDEPEPTPPESAPMSSIPQIVDYAQQSFHFGGEGCKVMLIGTQVDCVADSYEERNQAAAHAFQRIQEETPQHLQSRFHTFPPCGTARTAENVGPRVGVCTINNENELVDIGVRILRNSLIHECMRERPAVTGRSPHNGGEGAAVQQQPVNQPPYLQGNQVPLHWYRFELELRKDDWQKVDFCSVRKLWEYTRADRFQLQRALEFAAVLASLNAAGVIVLCSDIPWEEIQESGAVPALFLESMVIIRPQWIIEVGRRLLPHPNDDMQKYESRFKDVSSSLRAAIRKFWSSAIIDAELLKVFLGRQEPLDDDTLKLIVPLFERRLILCPTRSESGNGSKGDQWFAPSMVAFHAEFSKVPGASFLDPSSSDIHFTLNFDWLPPGLPMLFVGAMFRYMKNEPSFSVSDGSEHIQFNVGLSGHAPLVFIDLPNGAGGKTISLWTEIKRPVRPCIENLMKHILDSVHTACRLLYVQPLLENPTQTVERGLLVSFTVPLIRQQLVSKLPSQPLRDVCCRDPEFLPDGCEKDATSLLYQECLAKYCSRYEVRDEWLGSFALPPEPESSHRPAADNVPVHRTTGNPAQAASTSASGGGNVRPARRVRPRMQRRAMRILAS